LISKARTEAIQAHDEEIARRQAEIRELTAQAAALKKQMADDAKAWAEVRARQGEVLMSLDSIRKRLAG
jgi:hypothetical protein